MRTPARIHAAFRGFTLIEMLVSLVLFSAVGMALVMATGAGQEAERTVANESNASRSLRTIARRLTDELRSSSDARITVEHLPDGNDRLRFAVPIEVGTVLDWGVHDASLGAEEATHNRPGWSLCYTVESTTQNGKTTRRLLRQELDQTGALQRQRLLLERVRNGTQTPPGFTVRKQGLLWEITLSTEPRDGRGKGIQEVFHVQARNQN
ncbi:MAG: prepilin-type N-terminal cleavage/methylation domain-containing protein [Planctomycetes bacterium]|nr:prepilin-type N-terminal cleavage/methylation domain-containing protein [Planctomycetota bacterium]